LGIFEVAEFQRSDQIAFCKKALSAECELEKYKAVQEGKDLYIELKEVLNAT